MIDYIDQVNKRYRHLKKIYILDDTRDSVHRFNHHEDFRKMIEALKKHMQNFEQVKVAVVVDKPDITALSDIHKMMTNNIKNYHFQNFSTMEAAVYWLKMNA